MTYKGAIDEVKSLANNSLMPVIFKPSLKKIAETLEMERPTATLNENKGEWIPVSERLPENDTEVVYQSERGGVGSCHYYNGFNNYPNTDPDCIFTDIVAWIPIPEPYKADMRGE